MSGNTGHGHVIPRPDGLRARCGGPGFCKVCQTERAALEMTTNTIPSTASQAASILSHEFTDLMYAWAISKDGTPECAKSWVAIIDHIDAKLAQAVAAETARCQEIADARQRGWDSQWDEEMAKARVQIAEQEREKAFDNHPELLQLREQNKFMLDERDSLIARATAAEAKLEAIRQRAEGLDEIVVKRDVLALFTTPPKADESGLPG